MALDFRRIYVHAVLGSLGGLVGWALTIPTVWLEWTGTIGLLAKDALIGILVGAAIGTAVSAYDGLFVSHSFGRLLGGGTMGGVVGALGGALGLTLSEAVFTIGGGGTWPRALGWALFGLLVGGAQGLSQRSWSKLGYGLIGGLLGGLVGGSTYERTSVLLQMVTQDRALGLGFGGALGLTILGAAIGGLIGLVEIVLRTAWLKFTRGRIEGQTITLDSRKRTQWIGRAADCTVIIPGDPDVQPHHAAIVKEGNSLVIVPREGPVLVHSAGKYSPIQRHPLRDQDRVQVGQSRFTFLSGRKGANP